MEPKKGIILDYTLWWKDTNPQSRVRSNCWLDMSIYVRRLADLYIYIFFGRCMLTIDLSNL